MATSDDGTTGFDLVCVDILKSIGPSEVDYLRRAHAFAFRCQNLEGSELKLQRSFATELTAECKHLLISTRSSGSDLISELETLLVVRFNLPALSLFDAITNYRMHNQFALNTLLKQGLLKERAIRVHYIDGDIEYKLLERRWLGTRETNRSFFTTYLLSPLASVFMQRCVDAIPEDHGRPPS